MNKNSKSDRIQCSVILRNFIISINFNRIILHSKAKKENYEKKKKEDRKAKRKNEKFELGQINETSRMILDLASGIR